MKLYGFDGVLRPAPRKISRHTPKCRLGVCAAYLLGQRKNIGAGANIDDGIVSFGLSLLSISSPCRRSCVIGGPRPFFLFLVKLLERNGGGGEVDLAIGKTNDRALFSFECVAMASMAFFFFYQTQCLSWANV
jgi:hypothetical protein